MYLTSGLGDTGSGLYAPFRALAKRMTTEPTSKASTCFATGGAQSSSSRLPTKRLTLCADSLEYFMSFQLTWDFFHTEVERSVRKQLVTADEIK